MATTPSGYESVLNDQGIASSTSCTLCRASFNSVQEQRRHVKSDFHRYNLKLSIKHVPPVDEATFTRLIGDLDESLSGSDSEESEESEGDSGRTTADVTLSTLLKRQAKISKQERGGGDDDNHNRSSTSSGTPGISKTPLLWMTSPKIDDDARLGLYKAILTNEEQANASRSLIDIIKTKQLKPIVAKHRNAQADGARANPAGDPHFFLCMIGGGHFAAMIVSLIPELRKGPGGVEERHPVVRAHKTFHRYTTRRKQGGSQSANDNAKGNAHSAGSSIRRYNEAALETDVRAVLSEWKNMIDSAELLFIRATGTTNRRTLFGPYDGQVLHSNDKRLRGFPFSTRRATQAELLRSFQELTRLKVGKVIEKANDGKPPVEKSVAKEPRTRVAALKLSKEEEAAQLHTTQLRALIRRSKAPGVLLYLSKNELSPNFLFYPSSENHHAPTPLHLSASSNSPALVLALVTKAKADPTVKNEDGKTAYEIAGDARTRDAFRVARHQLGEGAFDWAAARVPAPLSQADADAKAQQEKEALATAEALRRKADLERIREEDERRNVGRIERRAGTGKSLATAEKTGSEKREEEMRGLTPELRMKLERERRARAAEERIRRMQGAR